MRRLVLPVLAALLLPTPALGKELAKVTVCGVDGCTTLTDRDDLRAFPTGDEEPMPPPGAGPFFTVELTARAGVNDDSWTIWYSRKVDAISFLGEHGNAIWHPVGGGEATALLRRLSAGLEPFPAPRVTSVRIGDRLLTEGAESYLALFTQPAGRPVADPTLTDWVQIDLRSLRPTPWTASGAEFAFSAEGGALERSWELVALPEGTAASISAGAPLDRDAGGGRLPSWPLLAGLAGLAVLGVLARRRRRLALALAGAALTLVLAAPALGKFPIALRLSDSTPRVGQQVRITVSIPQRYAKEATMRVVAVPPGMGMYDAIKAEERHGVELTRSGATWRGSVRFRRSGRWLLVVPNWGAPGYALPPPVVRHVRVARR